MRWVGGLAALLLAGCTVTQATWTPPVDTYDDPDRGHLQQDEVACRSIAQEAARNALEKTAEEERAGGVVGAVAGLGGSSHEELESTRVFKETFGNCLKERGHPVLD